jgi:hypothetical protein
MTQSWDFESEGDLPDSSPAPTRGARQASESPGPSSIDRRRFLVLVGGAAAYQVLRPHESWARKLRGQKLALQPWAIPPHAPSSQVELARAVIGAAVLAPSTWNTQPWRWEVDPGQIRLTPDPQRALPITDPDQKSMTLSLGAALENLLVTLRAYGYRPSVQYAPAGGSPRPVAAVSWTNGEPRPRDRELFAAITERRTNRREYDGRGLYPQNRAALLAQIPEDLRIHWLDDRDRIREVADLVHDVTRAQVRDRRAQAERMAWMRFGDDQARQRGDGVTLEALDVGGPARWFAGNYFDPKSWFLRFGARSAAKQARAAVRSAGALALLTAPRRDETLWLIGGQAYQRLALKATVLGVAQQPIDTPIGAESARGELLRRFAAGGQDPLLLIRLGHAKRPPASVRRAVSLVASFRNS